MKGIQQTRPQLPRYKETWDVSILLDYLSELMPLEQLPLRELTKKVATLLLLLMGQRVQTVHLLDIRNIKDNVAGLQIIFGDQLKQSRPGYHLNMITLPPYSDEGLCPVATYRHYQKRTQSIRGQITQLLITSNKPTKAAKRDTIAGWVKETLGDAGIDITKFTAHSVRSASTSQAKHSLPVQVIMEAAGWSSENTYRKYYDKPISELGLYAKAILHAS